MFCRDKSSQPWHRLSDNTPETKCGLWPKSRKGWFYVVKDHLPIMSKNERICQTCETLV